MKRRLFMIFGPILLAVMLVGICLFTPIFEINNSRFLEDASSSMARNVITTDSIKDQALRSKRYVPFFGSSELSRFSPFHPTVLAEKYHRNYHPFLLGSAGTQSLSQFMMMQSMDEGLKNRKVVFIISPQWFEKGGVNDSYFEAFYSKQQTLDWALGLKTIQPEDRYMAQRLSEYQQVTKDSNIQKCLQAIKNNQLPSEENYKTLQAEQRFLKREDRLFGPVGIYYNQWIVDNCKKQLPAQYDYQKLQNLATQIGQKKTKNNEFRIDSGFYSTRIGLNIKHFKNSQTDYDYRRSKEFSDFQLVLTQLAKDHTEALFIIPPLNKRWTDYTGFSQEMLQEFAAKITYQLNSQGFNHVVDLTSKGSEPYFMEDTIHLGWRGWLEADQSIEKFLRNTEAGPVAYHIDSYYLSKEWQNKMPETIKKQTPAN